MSLKKLSLPFLAMVLALAPVAFLSAQSGELPPDARPGQCFAKCLIPDEYETVTDQILLKEESSKLSITPATYSTIEETVMVKDGYNVLKVVPPTYTTVTEEVMVKEASSKLVVTPAVYETISEQVLVSPATTKWVRGKATPDCVSSNPDDCRVWCLKEIPAEYRTVNRKVVQTPPVISEVAIPAQYKTIKRTVVQTPAQVVESSVDPQYKTVTKQVVNNPASTSETIIPAEFKTITSKRLVRTGGFTEWREVLCESNQNSSYIRSIQQALKDRGYDPGPIDGVIGSQTRTAIRSFQTDNGLAVGVQGRSIPYETLKALGL